MESATDKRFAHLLNAITGKPFDPTEAAFGAYILFTAYERAKYENMRRYKNCRKTDEYSKAKARTNKSLKIVSELIEKQGIPNV